MYKRSVAHIRIGSSNRTETGRKQHRIMRQRQLCTFCRKNLVLDRLHDLSRCMVNARKKPADARAHLPLFIGRRAIVESALYIRTEKRRLRMKKLVELPMRTQRMIVLCRTLRRCAEVLDSDGMLDVL